MTVQPTTPRPELSPFLTKLVDLCNAAGTPVEMTEREHHLQVVFKSPRENDPSQVVVYQSKRRARFTHRAMRSFSSTMDLEDVTLRMAGQHVASFVNQLQADQAKQAD